MSETTIAVESAPVEVKQSGDVLSSILRVARYMAIRTLTLFVTVVIGIYLVVLIANMGGYVDEIRRGAIREQISMNIYMSQDPQIKLLSGEQKNQLIAEQVALEETRRGLDRPFIIRSFAFLTNAITLDLGFAEDMISDTGSKQVRLILLERLVPTLLLWGIYSLLYFFIALFMGLFLSRRYGTWLDRFVIAMTPTSSAPGWFYGLFLILIFAGVLRILPFGGLVDAPPPESKILYALSVLKHLVLPTTALLISGLFIGIFNRRTFFLIYSQEDYVEMAKAKGVPDRLLERRYILKPTLPPIITEFLLVVIAVWTGGVITETVFNWPGLGRALYAAIGSFDTAVIVGAQVIYAYLLAMTVLLLDFLYAVVDPRVRIGEQGKRV